MKLYHWKAAGYDFLVMAESEQAARECLLPQVFALSTIDPKRAELAMADIEKLPYFVAGSGHVIAVDSGRP